MATFTENPDFTYVEKTAYNTLVSEFENGAEQRRAKWGENLKRFKLEYKSRPQADYATVKTFFDARQGKYESFTWTNPLDSTAYTVRFDMDELEVKNTGYQIYDFTLMFKEVK